MFRAAAGMWAIRGSTRFYFGLPADWARPADYDGNGMGDIGIFRDSTGLWSVRNLTQAYFGASGDIPVTR